MAAEEPVTARIHRRVMRERAAEQAVAPAAPPVEIPPPAACPPAKADEPSSPAVIGLFPITDPATQPQPGYRQQIARGRRQDVRQLSLF